MTIEAILTNMLHTSLYLNKLLSPPLDFPHLRGSCLHHIFVCEILNFEG